MWDGEVRPDVVVEPRARVAMVVLIGLGAIEGVVGMGATARIGAFLLSLGGTGGEYHQVEGGLVFLLMCAAAVLVFPVFAAAGASIYTGVLVGRPRPHNLLLIGVLTAVSVLCWGAVGLVVGAGCHLGQNGLALVVGLAVVVKTVVSIGAVVLNTTSERAP